MFWWEDSHGFSLGLHYMRMCMQNSVQYSSNHEKQAQIYPWHTLQNAQTNLYNIYIYIYMYIRERERGINRDQQESMTIVASSMCSFHANKKILDLKDFLAPRNADGWPSVPTSTGSFGTHRILPSPRKVPAGGNPIEIIFGSTPPIYTTKHAPTFPRPPIIHPGYVPPIISVIHWKTANGLERDSRFMERVAWQPPKKTSTNHHLSIYYIYIYMYIYIYIFLSFHISYSKKTDNNGQQPLRTEALRCRWSPKPFVDVAGQPHQVPALTAPVPKSSGRTSSECRGTMAWQGELERVLVRKKMGVENLEQKWIWNELMKIISDDDVYNRNQKGEENTYQWTKAPIPSRPRRQHAVHLFRRVTHFELRQDHFHQSAAPGASSVRQVGLRFVDFEVPSWQMVTQAFRMHPKEKEWV